MQGIYPGQRLSSSSMSLVMADNAGAGCVPKCPFITAKTISNSRTCEMGLSKHAGIPYHRILYLVGQAAK